MRNNYDLLREKLQKDKVPQFGNKFQRNQLIDISVVVKKQNIIETEALIWVISGCLLQQERSVHR